MAVEADGYPDEAAGAKAADIDPAYGSRILGLSARMGELAMRNPLDPALKDEVRALGREVLQLGDALEKIQTGLAVLKGQVPVEAVADIAPRSPAAPARPGNQRPLEAMVPGVVDFYAGVIDLTHLGEPEDPEGVVVEIVGDFTLRICGQDIEVNRDVVFCLNALLVRGENTVTGSWIKDMGFRKETSSPGAERAKNSALAIALKKIEMIFLKAGVRESILRSGVSAATRYWLSPTLQFVDRRTETGDEGLAADESIDAAGTDNSNEGLEPEPALSAPSPTASAEGDLVITDGGLQPQGNSLAAIKTYIEREYPDLVVKDGELTVAAENPLIRPQYEGKEVFYSYYAANKIVRAVVEAAGREFIAPD